MKTNRGDDMEKKFYWLKLKRDFFKRHDVRIVEATENGKEILLFYIKLLLESIDHDGRLRFNSDVPYSDTMLSALFDTRLEVVQQALKVLSEFEMVEIESDGTIVMTKFTSFAGAETEAAVKKRAQRNLPTLINGSKRLNGSSIITPDGKVHTIDEKRYGGNGMLALDRSMGKCEVCGSTESIVVHHNNGYSTDLDDLVVLCSNCHGKAHSRKNNGHLNIERPAYVHQMSTDCPPNVPKMSVQSIENRDKRKENRDKRKSEEKNPYGEFSHVLLTDTEYSKLSERYGEAKTTEYIVKLDRYIENYPTKGNKYKSHYATILNWIEKDGKEAKTTSEQPKRYNPYNVDDILNQAAAIEQKEKGNNL